MRIYDRGWQAVVAPAASIQGETRKRVRRSLSAALKAAGISAQHQRRPFTGAGKKLAEVDALKIRSALRSARLRPGSYSVRVADVSSMTL